MNAEYFRTLFRYHYWAWARVLDQVAKLSQDEYAESRPLDYGSLRATLVHALSAESGYLARWDGKPVESPISEETVATVDALRDRWSGQQQKMDAFLADLTNEGTTREIKQVSARTGQESVTPLWVLMAQIVNHGTQHRSEVALTITQLGHSPGDLDITRYWREQR